MPDQPVTSIEEIVENLIALFNTLQREDQESDLARGLLVRGRNIVVLRRKNFSLFGPSRFSGYPQNSVIQNLNDPGGGDQTDRALDGLLGKQIQKGAQNWSKIDSEYQEFCENFGVKPYRRERGRSYWLIGESDLDIDEFQGPVDQLSNPIGKSFIEGGLQQVIQTKYERSPSARKACLEAHGFECSVCEMNFRDQYGDIGDGFIHVHHLRPISTRGKKYKIDPVNDLVPVCPNCHAMLHRSLPPLTPDELKRVLHSL